MLHTLLFNSKIDIASAIFYWSIACLNDMDRQYFLKRMKHLRPSFTILSVRGQSCFGTVAIMTSRSCFQ